MKKSLHIIAAFACIAPIAYLLLIFPQLPGTVPTHFDLNGKPDDWDTKNQFLTFTFIMSGASILTYLLLCNVYRIDPKKKAFENKDRLQKIAFAVVLFMAAIQLWIIHITNNGTAGKEPRFVFVAVGILLSVIGNYMENIKPNYFAGLRLPWTLENEENWRKTHHYASRIWFVGGLVIAVCSLVLPFNAALIVLVAGTLVMTLVPSIYSYRLYKAQKEKMDPR